MADSTTRKIENGATLPGGKGKVNIRLQGLGTYGPYGSEEMEERLDVSPPRENSSLIP